MKTKTMMAVIALISTQAFANVKECNLDTHAPEFRQSVSYGLSRIDSTLDLSTLTIERGDSSTYYGIKHYDYKVTVKNSFGNTFHLETFTVNRKTNELLQKVGGLIVSDIFVSTLRELDGTTVPYKCEAQYLSFTSSWFPKEVIYATRLVDENGFANNSVGADIFDRLLRAGSARFDNP